jgi:ABC-type transporter Mla MlaB component
MLKISEAKTANCSATLKLEGRVIGPWVDELRDICDKLLAEGRAVRLDLTDVSYVDADGVAALTSFKSRGVKLRNSSSFVEQQIKNST